MSTMPPLLERLIALVRATHTHIEVVYQKVPPAPPKPGEPFDFNRSILPVLKPCYDVPGAPIEILIESGAWAATGNDLVSCEDEMALLLERHPDYPMARVELPPFPGISTPFIPPLRTWQEALKGEMDVCQAVAMDANLAQQWFETCIDRIETSISIVVQSGQDLQAQVERFKHDRWHITSMDPHNSTVNLLGQSYKISFGAPTKQPQDLNTLFLWPVIAPVWRGRGKPLIRLKTAQYGTKTLAITVGRRGCEGKTYWLDLGKMALIRDH